MPAILQLCLKTAIGSPQSPLAFMIHSADPQYFKDMFAMVLSAFHTGSPVSFFFTVSGGQCLGDRVFVYKQ